MTTAGGEVVAWRQRTKWRLLATALGAGAMVLIAAEGCSAPPGQLNRDPADAIAVEGTLPGDLEVHLTATWRTTVVTDACAPRASWPIGLRFPRQQKLPVPLERRQGGQASWRVWRDQLLAGECGWRLAAVELQALRSSPGSSPDWGSVAASPIAFACLDGSDCVERSARMNDDEAIAVHLYCRFPATGQVARGAAAIPNPCAYGGDGKLAGGTGAIGKEQHVLLPSHHHIRFILTELQAQ